MSEYVINKGSDLEMRMIWTDDAGPVNLTGYAVAIYDAHPKIAPHVTAEITDAAGGVVSVRMDWDESMPVGGIMHFRVKLRSGTNDVTTPMQRVRIQ